MDPNELIDAQFEKAVSIVQSLPKTGPIQTGYEEKLAMYRYICPLFPKSSPLMKTIYGLEACINKVCNSYSACYAIIDHIVSNRWKREGTSAWALGYARQSKMVSRICVRRSFRECSCLCAGMHGQNTRM